MSENQGKTRQISECFTPKGKGRQISEYFTPKVKVSSLGSPQPQCFVSQVAYFQASPMKVTNWTSEQLHTRLLSLQTIHSPNKNGDSFSTPKMPKPVAHCLNNASQGHKRTASNVFPAGSNCSFRKRCKDSEGIDSSLKKQCPQNTSSDTVQTPNCTTGQSRCLLPVSSPSPNQLINLDLSLDYTANLLSKEPAFCHLMMVPEHGPNPTAESPLRFKPSMSTSTAAGVKKAFLVNITENCVLLKSPGNSVQLSLNSLMGEARNREGSSTSSISAQQLFLGSSGTPDKDSSKYSNPTLQVMSLGKDGKSGETTAEKSGDACKTPKQTTKSTTGPVRSHTLQKSICRRRPSLIITNDIDPDPLTHVINATHKAVTPGAADQGKLGSQTSVEDTKDTSSAQHIDMMHKYPIVKLHKLNVEKYKSLTAKRKMPLKADTTGADSSTYKHSSSPTHTPANEKKNDWGRTMDEEDELDMELGLGLISDWDFELSESSQSSEGEQLVSLQEMMQRAAKPPDTPEKGAFPEPTTPILPRHHSTQTVHSTLLHNYRNNLDLMLIEMNHNKRSKVNEATALNQLSSFKEEDLRMGENEEAEGNQDEAITSEQREFLQRFAPVASPIKDVHPGEVVFNLDNFGRIFSQHTLQLKHCKAKPQSPAQKTLLWSSPAQLSLHISIGLFQYAYESSPCPPQVTHFLFKMMSVHTERMISDQILQVLRDIALTAANQRVKNGSQEFEVWVPSVADLTLILINMGASFVTLFPLEKLQPPFTEGELLKDVFISTAGPSSNIKVSTFPKHNYSNILKYLSYCMCLCPRSFSDRELLLLLTVVSRLALEVQLTLQPNVDLRSVLGQIVDNFMDWEESLPRVCLALMHLTDDHHNMCWLVQLLPDHPRGKLLCRHLCVSMISKLLNGHCTYKPSGKEFKLCDLQPYLPRMKPSRLLNCMRNSACSEKTEREDDRDILDQKTYYLCYSLLTLVTQASNYPSLSPDQKEQLLQLCLNLDRHVKCDIQKSDPCLYRSKVADLVARIYTKWQMLLQQTKPLHDKVYDWQPSPGDKLNGGLKESASEDSNESAQSDKSDQPPNIVN